MFNEAAPKKGAVFYVQYRVSLLQIVYTFLYFNRLIRHVYPLIELKIVHLQGIHYLKNQKTLFFSFKNSLFTYYYIYK